MPLAVQSLPKWLDLNRHMMIVGIIPVGDISLMQELDALCGEYQDDDT